METQAPNAELRNLKIIIGLAVGSALIAALAGLTLTAGGPAPGSDAEAALGFTAAITGLATAGFAIAAAVYAQIKNLWRYAPAWIRRTLWALIAVAITMTVLNMIEQVLDLF